MNALVTGATGFIGSHLVKELVREKHSVRALVLPGEDVSALETQGVTVWRGDLSKRESLRGICNGIDVVFHLAARVTDWGTKKQFYDAIYTATKNLIEEASGNAARFVYISSIAALGCNRHLKGVKAMERIGEWVKEVYSKQ
jgi:nucleoside-diphosphate-sugar epimerase